MTAPHLPTPATATELSEAKGIDEIVHNAEGYGVATDVAASAARFLTQRESVFVGMSAKMAGGKDSTAQPVLGLIGVRHAEQHSFAFALKDELDRIFADIRYWAEHMPSTGLSMSQDARWSLAGFLSANHDIPVEQAFTFFTDKVAANVLSDPTVHSRVRTPEVRFALQMLGTDVRRAQDDLYWVKRTVRPAAAQLALGKSVYFTDDRFPNEVDSVRDLSGLAVRLDVTRETQLERLRTRDGLDVSDEALNHISETALDDYPHFDVRVSNDGTPDQTLAAIRDRLRDLGLLRELAAV